MVNKPVMDGQGPASREEPTQESSSTATSREGVNDRVYSLMTRRTCAQFGRFAIPLSAKRTYTSEDYWNLPDGVRAELIDGELYDMTPPSWTHQMIVSGIVTDLNVHIRAHGGTCKVATSPVAVNLDADDKTWVEPDVVVVCDPRKLSERGVEGAPDMIVEVVSPSSVGMDYMTKTARYRHAGVREYWIVDPMSSQTAVYQFRGEEIDLKTYPFSEPAPVGIFEGLAITMSDLTA